MLELGTSWGYWVQPFYDVKCRNHQKSTERPIGPSLVAFSIAWGGYPCCHRQRPHGLRLWNPKGSLSSHHLHACLYQGESPTWKVKACVERGLPTFFARGVSNLLMICDFFAVHQEARQMQGEALTKMICLNNIFCPSESVFFAGVCREWGCVQCIEFAWFRMHIIYDEVANLIHLIFVGEIWC